MSFNTSLPVNRVPMVVAAEDTPQDVVLVAKAIDAAYTDPNDTSTTLIQLRCGVDFAVSVPLATIDEWLLLQWTTNP